MMLWCNFDHHLLSLAALLVIVSCGGGEQRRGTDSSSTSSTGGGSSSSSSSSSSSGSSGGSGSNNYSNRRFHKIQHGQCTYTFILPEGDGARGGSCREAKAGSAQQNANSLQRDAPPPEPEFPSQKIQQLEHIMENYTQWLQKVRNGRMIPQKYRLFIYLPLKSRNACFFFFVFLKIRSIFEKLCLACLATLRKSGRLLKRSRSRTIFVEMFVFPRRVCGLRRVSCLRLLEITCLGFWTRRSD